MTAWDPAVRSLDHLHLVSVSGGGLLLDTRTGNVYQLNDAAREIWELRLDKTADDREIAHTLQARRNLSEDAAEEAVRATALPPRDPSREQAASGFEFGATSQDGLIEVRRRGVRHAVISPIGFALEVEEIPADLGLRPFLRYLAPRLLNLHGHHVLHAAGVRLPNDEVLAFSGRSGAGKTTTARLMEEAGVGKCVSEDMLCISSDGAVMTARTSGEPSILEWVDREGERSGAPTTMSYKRLLSPGAEGESCPVGTVFFLGPRISRDITSKTMGPAAAAAHWFRQSFPGSPDPDRWGSHLASVVAHSTCVENLELSMPEGIEHAREAVLRYSWMRKG